MGQEERESPAMLLGEGSIAEHLQAERLGNLFGGTCWGNEVGDTTVEAVGSQTGTMETLR